MDGQQGGGVPPQYSPDGKWWSDGSTWVQAQQSQAMMPAAPPRARMPHQRPSFWIGLGVTTLILAGMGACETATGNSPSTQPGANVTSVVSTPSPTATPAATSAPTPTPTAAPTATPPPTPAAAPPVAAPPPTAAPAPPAGCYPLSNSGTCYEPGEFCRTSDHGRTGRAGNGEAIVCEYNDGWRWEPA